MKRFIVLLLIALIPLACSIGPINDTPNTPTTTVGTTANGVPVNSFCDPRHPTRIYYIEYQDSGGNHIAVSAIADASCAK